MRLNGIRAKCKNSYDRRSPQDFQAIASSNWKCILTNKFLFNAEIYSQHEQTFNLKNGKFANKPTYS